MTLMNQAQFARHIKRDRSFVTHLKQNGRLVMRAGKVDVEESEKLIAESSDPARDLTVQRHEENRQKKAIEPPEPDKNDEITGRAGSMYQNARAIKEKYGAMQAKIAYEKEIGTLLDAEQAKAAVANGDAIIRSRLEALPDVLAPQLAAEIDEQKVRALLMDHIEQLLGELSRTFYAMAK